MTNKIAGWLLLFFSVGAYASGFDYQYTKINSPRNPEISLMALMGFPDKEVQTRVNKELMSRLLEMGCERQKGNWTTKAKVTYAADLVFSEAVESEYFCGGPHPDIVLDWFIFDLREGKRIRFANLFRDYNKDGPEIAQLAFSKFIDERALASDENCNGKFPRDKIRAWADVMQAHISVTGVVLTPELPYALRSCTPRVTVPISKLLPYAAPKGILPRLVQRRSDLAK